MTNDNDDPFALAAEEMMTSPMRAQLKAARTRAERREAKRVSDKQVLWNSWHEAHQARIKKLTSGKHHKGVAVVNSFLERMTIDDGEELITLVRHGPWRDADDETRFLLLGLISARLVYLRTAEGLPPFDDSIPGVDEDRNVFEIIREILLDVQL